MKKIFCTIIAICMLFSGAYVYASNIAGEVYISGVNAFIDGYPIPLYSFNGYPYIYVKDLNLYGYDVVFDNSTRTVNITRNTQKPFTPYNEAGNNADGLYKAGDIYNTDIRVYLNSNQTEAYNLDNNMIICMDFMACFGTVKWYQDSKTIAFTSKEFENANTAWESIMPEKYINYRNNTKNTSSNYYNGTAIPDYTALTGEAVVNTYKSGTKGLLNYVYRLNSESAQLYINLLCDYLGFEVYDTDSDLFGTYSVYYLTKGESVVSITLDYLRNEAVVIPY